MQGVNNTEKYSAHVLEKIPKKSLPPTKKIPKNKNKFQKFQKIAEIWKTLCFLLYLEDVVLSSMVQIVTQTSNYESKLFLVAEIVLEIIVFLKKRKSIKHIMSVVEIVVFLKKILFRYIMPRSILILELKIIWFR